MACTRPSPRTSFSPRGFSLIELMIVIVVLGILAAIATPQFTNSSAEARRSSLATMARTLGNQAQVYKLQHGDVLPDLAAASALGNHFGPLMTVTTYNGRDYGPYAMSLAVNPFTEGSTVMNAVSFTNGVPDPVPGADFIYDYGGGHGTGALWGTTDRATGTVLQ